MSKKILKLIPDPHHNESPLEYSSRVSVWYNKSLQERKKGQIFTPTRLAKYMAASIPSNFKFRRILDPGVGTASLSCALIERIASFRRRFPIEIHAIEIDSSVSIIADYVLKYAKKWARRRGVDFDFKLYNQDFIDFGLAGIGMPSTTKGNNSPYDLVIMNPPYHKINLNSSAIGKLQRAFESSSNMYTLFISLAVRLLRTGGYLVSVNPRSFFSGKYFERFRRDFFDCISPYRIHRFISRESVFSEAEILQEIVIVVGVKNSGASDTVSILSSNGTSDIDFRTSVRTDIGNILSEHSDRRLALPLGESDIKLLEETQKWASSLDDLGINVSTGPVVPFRTKDLVCEDEDGDSVPLLWMQNIKPFSIHWPLEINKPQYIHRNNGLKPLVANGKYILLRRFISKDCRSRLIAALVPGKLLQYNFIGVENHLNILHENWHDIDSELSLGLCGFLNSTLLSKLFHMVSGTTQVNAYDLRLLPIPNRQIISKIGEEMKCELKSSGSIDAFDKIVEDRLSDL